MPHLNFNLLFRANSTKFRKFIFCIIFPADKNITRVDLPDNVIGKGVGYTKQSLPKEHFIELYVTHIRTPDCFWLQLLKYATKVEELQEEMR